MHLLFETSVSTLYYSNDGLVRVKTERSGQSPLYTVVKHGEGEPEIVLQTRKRLIADAYIAGYDLATA